MSCSQKRLVSDEFNSSSSSNYQSALIIHDNQKYFGLHIIQAPLTGSVSFSIQGIYNGNISVRSRECGINENKYYSNSAKIDFQINPSNPRCLLSINVQPDFPKEMAFVKWTGVFGLVLIKRDNHEFISDTHQIREEDFSWFKFTVLGAKTRIYLKGCGQDFDKIRDAGINTGFIFWKKDPICVLEGFVKSDIENKTIIQLASFYKPKFLKFPSPEIVREKEYIEFKSSSSTSLIVVDSKPYFKNSVKVSTKNHEVIFYTVQGRVSYCSVFESGEHVCLN